MVTGNRTAKGFIALAAAWVALSSPNTPAADLPPLTVADAIETTRAMTDDRSNAVFTSPDGRSYVVMLIRGDVKRDGVWVELLAGQLNSMDAAKPQVAAKFFTDGLGIAGSGGILGGPNLLQPWQNFPVWLNDRTVALRWIDDKGNRQVVAVDTVTHTHRFLTAGDRDIAFFTPGPGGHLIYDVRRQIPRERTRKSVHDGFAVTTKDVMPVLAGLIDLDREQVGFCDRFLSSWQTSAAPQMLSDGATECQLTSWDGPHFATDNTLAIMRSYVGLAPGHWDRYTDEAYFKQYLELHRRNPYAFLASSLRRIMVADLKTASLRPLWDAPVGIWPPTIMSWAPDRHAVVLGPTFTPVENASAAGLGGRALVEVNVDTGAYTELPLDAERAAKIEKLEWDCKARLSVSFKEGASAMFAKRGPEWELLPTAAAASDRCSTRVPVKQSIEIQLRQDANTPPALYAVDTGNRRSRRLLELNPQLEKFALGRVEFIHWIDPAGHDWKGRLYYPANHSARRRYPLVIQTHGYADESEYSLYGQGPSGASIDLGPGWSVYLGQILASRGVAMLQVDGPTVSFDVGKPGPEASRKKREMIVTGIEAAARHLAARGLVDLERVGVMGHSATGSYVEDAFTLSSFQYRAGIAADYAAGNYVQAALYGWPNDTGQFIGAEPFGAGLKYWLESSPAFNVERIKTPLQIQLTSPAEGSGVENILWNWETFSRLQYLNKPVEYFVVPDVAHGSHALQNPRQLLGLQNRALDWWLFWLKDEEDSDASKSEQYRSWRVLRELHDQDLKTPRPPRLKWTAEPLAEGASNR